MSHTRSLRRLALLAGSFLTFLTPAAAWAYDECTPTAASGTLTDGAGGTSDPTLNAGPDSFTCSASDYPGGITYTSSGGGLTVVTSGTGTITTNAGGVNLTGVGADAVTFTANRTMTGTSGPVIDVTAATGAITISTTAGLTATSGTASHAIRALSTGGTISVTTGVSAINANSNSVTQGEAAIEARATGGSGAVSVTTGTGAVTGRLRGIYAQASGSGALTITTNGNVSLNTTTTAGGVGQVAAIDAIAGTGLLKIDINGGSVTGTAGSGIRAVAGANAEIGIVSGRTVSAGLGSALDATPTHWVMDIDAAGLATINNAGTIRSTVSQIFGPTGGAAVGHRAIKVDATDLVLNNSGLIRGRVDFSLVTGDVVFNNTGSTGERGWYAFGLNRFGSGSNTLNIAAGGGVFLGNTYSEDSETTLDFEAGADDAINNAGRFVPGALYIGGEAATTANLIGLEAFNNSGVIAMGNDTSNLSVNLVGDNGTDDRLVMHGTTFTGSGASRIVFDVNLAGGAQPDCSATVAADCIDLSGGETAGATSITLIDSTPGQLYGGFLPEPIVLIDVGGGVSSAEHFAFDPSIAGYMDDANSAANNGLIKIGYFLYDLGYSEATQRHGIVSAPDTEIMEFTILPQTVQGLWQTATTSWFDRQADLRAAAEAGPGVWLRAGGEESKRDLVQTFSNDFSTFVSFDNSYEQKTVSLTGGVDLVTGGDASGDYVLGAMLGYVKSDVDFTTSATALNYKGGVLGAYGSYARGGFHLDAIVNGLVLMMDVADPYVGPPAGLTTRETVRAVGGQAEAGYRMERGGFYVEPLASVSYARTRFDLIPLTEVGVSYEDAVSLRAGAGVRVGGVAGIARFSLTSRYLNELEGENEVIIDNDGADLPLTDDFSGSFGEVSGAVVLDPGTGFAGFLGAGVKFADDYQATNVSLGLTYRW